MKPLFTSLEEGNSPINCSKPDWDDRIIDQLKERGIAVYTNLTDTTKLLGFAEKVGGVFIHRDGDSKGFSDLTLGSPGQTSPSQFVHTDSAGEVNPPDLLVVHCTKKAEQGGNSILVDVANFCEVLYVHHREAFEAIQQPEIGCIRSGKELYRGAYLVQQEDGQYYFRFRPDNEQVSDLLAEHLVTLMFAAGRVMEFLELQDHSGYIAKNERWLHGRTSWSGERQALRLLINVDRSKPASANLPARGFDLPMLKPKLSKPT